MKNKKGVKKTKSNKKEVSNKNKEIKVEKADLKLENKEKVKKDNESKAFKSKRFSMKQYIISGEEKRCIKEFLDYENRFGLNFLLSSLEDNLILASDDQSLGDIYRDASMYINLAKTLYGCIYKQMLDEKQDIDKIYIPVSLKEYNILKKSKKINGYLLGTLQKFAAEAKSFPDIDDLVIIEAELKNVSIFKLDQSFEDSSLVIVGPFFKLIEKDEKYDIDENIYEENVEIQSRIFKKCVLEYVRNDRNDIKEVDLDKVSEDGGNKAKDMENYFEVLNYTKQIEKAIKDKDGKALEKLGITSEEIVEPKNEAEKIKKEIEAKAEDIKKRINILVDKASYTADGKPGKEIKELKKEIENENKKTDILDFERFEKNAKAQLDLNYLELHDLMKDIKEWKEKIVCGLNSDYNKVIAATEYEKNENLKKANFTQEEKELYKQVFENMQHNINMVDDVLNQTEELIRAQQKFAKIAAETNAKYSAVIDGFGIRNEAFKLKEVLVKEYTNFEEKYFSRIKNGEEKRISTSELNLIYDTSKQITVFLNMLFNPKMAKPNTKIKRFEELILIEENELKRQIFSYAKYLINEGNLDLLEEKIEDIENKSVIKKIISFITGNSKVNDYYLEKLEETIDRILEISEKEPKIDKNYRIYDIVAEIMLFESENMNDETVEDTIKDLLSLEAAISKNFEINSDKVLKIIEKKSEVSLPPASKLTKLDEIDIEIEKLIKKYEYDENIFVEKVEYQDTTKNEISKIVDYLKVAKS